MWITHVGCSHTNLCFSVDSSQQMQGVFQQGRYCHHHHCRPWSEVTKSPQCMKSRYQLRYSCTNCNTVNCCNCLEAIEATQYSYWRMQQNWLKESWCSNSFWWKLLIKTSRKQQRILRQLTSNCYIKKEKERWMLQPPLLMSRWRLSLARKQWYNSFIRWQKGSETSSRAPTGGCG